MTLRLANGRRLLEWINVDLAWVVLYWMTWCTLLEAPMELTLRLWNDTILTQTLGRWLLLWARQGLFSNSLIIDVSGLFDEQFLVFAWQRLFFSGGSYTTILKECFIQYQTPWNLSKHFLQRVLFTRDETPCLMLFAIIWNWFMAVRYINSQRWRLEIVSFFQIVEPQTSLQYRTYCWVDT